MIALEPEDFPVQVVDRIVFTSRTMTVAICDSRIMANDVAARLNAGEMWRLGVVEPEPVCTCRGGDQQEGGVRHRANDCPIHGEGDHEEEPGGWTLPSR